jgi:hypothetical protein
MHGLKRNLINIYNSNIRHSSCCIEQIVSVGWNISTFKNINIALCSVVSLLLISFVKSIKNQDQNRIATSKKTPLLSDSSPDYLLSVAHGPTISPDCPTSLVDASDPSSVTTILGRWRFMDAAPAAVPTRANVRMSLRLVERSIAIEYLYLEHSSKVVLLPSAAIRRLLYSAM